MTLMTAKDLRKQNQKKRHGEGHSCFACGKHPYITHLYHVIPLAEVADLFNDNLTKKISIPTVWLCPNCHTYVHWILNNSDNLKPIVNADQKTLERIIEVVQMYSNEKKKIMNAVMTDLISDVAFVEQIFGVDCGYLTRSLTHWGYSAKPQKNKPTKAGNNTA